MSNLRLAFHQLCIYNPGRLFMHVTHYDLSRTFQTFWTNPWVGAPLVCGPLR
ncbi:MAG TPA: hypothetical protein VGD78_20125 [Chthoniobacterales bacterium]